MIIFVFKELLQSMVKNSCMVLLLGCSLSGCLTIHNLNVSSGDNPPSYGPVAINTTGSFEENGGVKTPVPISEMGAPEAPPAFSLSSVNPSYSIHPGDTLDVKFYYNKDLNESVKVRPDGRISLQLVHDVQAALLSPDELVAVLTKKYSHHLKNPEISVIIRSMEFNKVFVDGQVNRSGEIKLLGNMSLMQSIANAGGLKDTARSGEVLLIRRNGLKRPFVYTVNLAAAMDGTDITQNVMLKASDIVYVPKSAIANINTWVDQYIRRNIPISVGMDASTIKIK